MTQPQLGPSVAAPATAATLRAHRGHGRDDQPSRLPVPGCSIGVPPGPGDGARLRRARHPGECATDSGGPGPVLLRVDLEDGLASFVALFRGPDIRDERQFEELLWEQLREVHAADEQPVDP